MKASLKTRVIYTYGEITEQMLSNYLGSNPALLGDLIYEKDEMVRRRLLKDVIKDVIEYTRNCE